ncbi:site-specific integrase [Kordiimonas sp.]|uniref:site-specific integrase n=1 Tax=Kordiimonas sp. TaxID=1970157 RepID=UPI003A923D37
MADIAHSHLAFDNNPLSQPIDEPNERVKDFLRASTSSATLKAYKSDVEHFLAWGGYIPASSQLIANYLADNAELLSVATLERRLAALSKIHSSLGAENTARAELVRTTMRGIRRSKGTTQRQAAPITKERLLAMVAACEDGRRGARDRALLLVGFAGAFRRSELVALNCKNVEFVPEGIVLTIERSKTDQEGRGRKVGIPYAQGKVCPVLALKEYLNIAGISKGPIFRPMASTTCFAETRLTSTSVSLAIKCRARLAGLDPAMFSGHSLRAGFATSAAQAGAETWAIMKQTGHQSEAIVHRYIRIGELFFTNGLPSIL